MKNFLKETIDAIEDAGYSTSDVIWVGFETDWITWAEFKKIADFDYNDGFGREIINLDLKIVAYDWWLERNEYDGSEWWELKRFPYKQPLTNGLVFEDLFENKDELNV